MHHSHISLDLVHPSCCTPPRTIPKIGLICSALGNSTKGKGTKVDVAELLAYVQPQIVKCYTPAKGPAHPMRPLVLALVKRLTAAPSAAAAQGA